MNQGTNIGLFTIAAIALAVGFIAAIILMKEPLISYTENAYNVENLYVEERLDEALDIIGGNNE